VTAVSAAAIVYLFFQQLLL
jgi:hypothetical protein